MKENDLVLGDEEIISEPELLDILDMQMSLLATVADLELSDDLYDDMQTDKIRAVSDCFRVIREIQKALLRQVKAKKGE